MKKLAPESIGQWTVKEDRVLDRESIYTQLNGGAEVYLHHGMERLLVREYQRPRAAPISLLIFDMARPRNAYGVFSHERAGVSAGVGQDSDMEGGLLRFWRHRYFVSITSYRNTAPARQAMIALGQEVAGRIGQSGQRPALVGRLPAEGRVEASVRYLRSEVILTMTLPELAGVDLGLTPDSEVVIARYAGDKKKPAGELTVLLATFASSAAAQKACKRLAALSCPLGEAHTRCCDANMMAVFDPGSAAARVSLMKKLARHKDSRCVDGK